MDELTKSATLLAKVVSAVANLIVSKNLGSAWDLFNSLLAAKTINLKVLKDALGDGVSVEERVAMEKAFETALVLPDSQFDGKVKSTMGLIEIGVETLEGFYRDAMADYATVETLIFKLRQIWT